MHFIFKYLRRKNKKYFTILANKFHLSLIWLVGKQRQSTSETYPNRKQKCGHLLLWRKTLAVSCAFRICAQTTVTQKASSKDQAQHIRENAQSLSGDSHDYMNNGPYILLDLVLKEPT